MKLSEDLKRSVLQAAIQGKLTEQRPEDGNAGDLLKKIRAEKKKLIAEGKIKKEKPLPSIDDDEKPFDIPDNWAWIRLGEIIKLISGTSYEKKDICKKGLRILRGGNLVNEKIEIFDDDVFLPGKYSDNEKKIKNQDIVIIASTGSLKGIGRAAFVNNVFKEAQIGAFLRIIRPIYNNIAEYIKIIFQGQYYREHISSTVNGIGIKNIKESYITEFLIPLPPLAEQERIVERVEAIMSKLDELDKAESELEALKKKFPGDMRDSLLQAAIQGKLTEQRAEDGNADDLLKEIRAEKKKLIAEGKIKKEKPLPSIDDYEKPFEIPDNWVWVRLGEISTYGKPIAKINAKNINKNEWILDLEDIEKGGKILRYRKAEELKSIGDKTIFHRGDILYSKLRPYLLKILLAPSDGFCTPELVPFRCYGKINYEYIIYFLKSPFIDNEVNQKTYGIKMPRVNKETMQNLLVPLPPLAEQNRIVKRLNGLLPLCEAMKGE